jgi:ELWxxDGT repeat protein
LDVFPVISNAVGAYNLGSANGMLLLGGNDDSNGIELWRSDGTPEGTVLVKDIVPGPDSSSPVSVANLNGAVLFTARDSNGDLNLWKTDGTENGTTLIALMERFQANVDGFYPCVYAATVTGNKAVFMVAATTNKVELWTTDGTAGGTHPIREFDRVLNGNSPWFLSSTSGMVFITTVPQPGKGVELWRTDGTSTGTFLVRDDYPRDVGSGPGMPVDCNGTVFFSANASELWKSDGTETGTIRVKAMSQDQGDSAPYNLVNVNGTLFFTLTVRSAEGDQEDELWKSDIKIEGDDQSQQDVHSMLYHLYSFVREGTALSPSPMGLSGLGYNGHVFWDTELWMYPSILVLHPEIAKSLVDYRYQRLDAAKRNAFSKGYKGAMYPWESAETGVEETPVWALSGPFEHHITACVGIAAWNYYCVTQDKQWLKEKGFPILSGTADFWASRVERNGPGHYDINNVVAADEWAENVNNNAFTNAAAKSNLQYATEAAKILGITPDADWMNVANNIPILKLENGVTREHAAYNGEGIKQADVNLLSYPLKEIKDPVSTQYKLAD